MKVRSNEKIRIPFKYENLSIFCFGCGRIVHGVKEYENVFEEVKNMPEEALPYSVALQAETNVRGKESVKMGFSARKGGQ